MGITLLVNTQGCGRPQIADGQKVDTHVFRCVVKRKNKKPELGYNKAEIKSMIFTIRNNVLSQIEDRAAFLEHLIEEYPRLLKEWTEKTDESFRKDAEESAEGDWEVYHDLYHSWSSAFDENVFREDMFYKSMLLMVYSYYEGAIEFLVRNTKSDDLVELICRSNNIELSDEAKEAKDRVKSDIRNLRNHLAHNNLMSSKHADHIKRISKDWPEINFSDDDITITGADYILDSLKKEKIVLKELCEKLGYKHKKVQTGK